MSDTDPLKAKFDLSQSNIWLTGVQAVARAVLEQAEADKRLGLNTGGYVTGYRGSPLGGLDLVLGRLSNKLSDQDVVFNPAVNEDLAATAAWGTQQVGLFKESQKDGVFGLWYGKSPGLDRSADAIRHANMAGTSSQGGVLAVVGDDPECKSSTLPSDSSGLLRNLRLPILDPSDVKEVIDFALYGWALSRFSGCWVSLLAQTSIMDSSATIQLPVRRYPVSFPTLDFDPHIRLIDTPLDQEKRLARRVSAVQAFMTDNPVNELVSNPKQPRLTFVTTGKSYSNLRQAFHLVGLKTTGDLEREGVRILKLGLIWPLDRDWLVRHVGGSQVICVVESKQAFIETSLRSLLYGRSEVPVVGKKDHLGQPLLSAMGELQIEGIQRAIWQLAQTFVLPFATAFKDVNNTSGVTNTLSMNVQRKPVFCPGCPHAYSTKIPDGSRAHAGIGCHYMAQWMHRETYLFTHMGGEGANWIGQAPFSDKSHVFVNLGDGTYFHSGLLAIRAAVAAGVNVTYKILFNDAVAMTGGQPVDGQLTVSAVVAQVLAEGVKEVCVVAEDPSLHRGKPYEVSARSQLQSVQRRLREMEGCTVLIVDHACANEKRRKQKRGVIPESDQFVVINEAVCEGCGDCVTQSACSAVVPVQTPYGEKRQIDQSHCIQDEACVEGYCPALVKVKGSKRKSLTHSSLPEIDLIQPPISDQADVLIAGVGGTGILTLSQILAAAAHIEGKQASSLDMTGLAQKGGSVISHVRIAPDKLWNTRIAPGEVEVLIGADAVTANSTEVANLLSKQKTQAILNGVLMPSYLSVVDGTNDHDISESTKGLQALVKDLKTIDSNKLANEFTGSGTASNIVLLGFASQLGLLPVRPDSIEKAIVLNGVSVEANLAGFRIGRCIVDDPTLGGINRSRETAVEISAERLIDERARDLVAYQGEKLSLEFKNLAESALRVDEELGMKEKRLTRATTRVLYKMFAYKDEYEVARLLTSDSFSEIVESKFERSKLTFAFAPTWLGTETNRRKIHLGSWFKPLLRGLATLKFLRSTWIDPFSYSKERRLDRQIKHRLIEDLNKHLQTVSQTNYDRVLHLFECYDQVKGYGHIRAEHWKKAKKQIQELEFALQDSHQLVAPRNGTGKQLPLKEVSY